jgi:hypothetical protein
VSPATVDGMRLADWWQSRDVPRSTAFRLIRAAGLEPGKMRVPGVRGPVTFLSAAEVEILDRLAQQLQHGRTIPEIEAAGLARTIATTSPDVPAGVPDIDALERRARVAQAVVAAGLPLSTAELGWLLGAIPGGPEVQRGDLLATRQGRNLWRLRRVEMFQAPV